MVTVRLFIDEEFRKLNLNFASMKHLLSLLALLVVIGCDASTPKSANIAVSNDSVATVYFIRDITPQNLVKIYDALGRKADGKNVAVKISTGESNKSNQLAPSLIEPLVKSVNGTIVECNTAYAGTRNTAEKHYQTAKEHGYTAIARVNIMDSVGEVELPVTGGFHMDKDIVGKDFLDYDFLIVLSHFKGHQMGGFGGALKNVAIGIASSNGKMYIHTAGKSQDPETGWGLKTEQDDFLESMADACQAVLSHVGDRVLYINVANNLSVDCDCNGNPARPEMGDLGILASLDPVALDRACVDMVLNAHDPGKCALIERINSRHGTHILDAAQQLGLGTQNYKIVELQ